jgi:23S rRNA pseudouridine2605 synthase
LPLTTVEKQQTTSKLLHMAQGFKKFMGKGDSGAKKKERIRQEKKKVRQETKEYFEKKKQEAREARAQGQAGGYLSQRGRNEQTEKRAGKGNEAGFKGNKATRQRSSEQGIEKKAPGYKPQAASNTRKAESFKPKAESNTGKATGYKPQAASFKGNEATRQRGSEQGIEAKRHKGIEKATYKPQAGKGQSFKPKAESNTGKAAGYKPQATSNTSRAESFKPKAESNTGKASKAESKPQTSSPTGGGREGAMPLNKFIAHAGICSRRDAAEVVKAGKVIVNGEKVLEPGYKVSDKDDIKVNGKKLFIRRNLVYILLNKPKDFITTTEDPQGRKTVMDIVRNATEERVYPIGRLDRNTTGVLLLTNDGELAQKLSHPSYEIKKIYEVKLDKPLVKKDFDSLLNGITLEDGFVSPDSLAYADPKDKSVIGIEIHSGRNRIVRRIFEHLGYDVRNLDRVMYANLTKKNVDRGKWRFLTEKEVRLLKYLNASYTKNKTVARG